MAELREELARGRRVVLAGWHQRLYLGIRPFAPLRPVIMISQSRDGERIARTVERLGWRPVRGSSSRGGGTALRAMVEAVSAGSVAAHVVDGPRGPARQVKRGLALLAQRSGAAIVPVYLGARRRLELRSWDRFHLPLPFTRVEIRLGPAIEVPPDATEGEQAALCERIEKLLEEGQVELDRRLRPRVEGS
jgi:hypothetical protein